MLRHTPRRASRRGLWGCLFILCWLLPRAAAAEAVAPLATGQSAVQPAPPAESEDEEDSVAGHWTATGSGFLSAGAGRFSYGGELGARYYVRRYFLTSLLTQYERLYWDYDLRKTAHGINLIARFELTIWNEEYRTHGLIPDASFYPLVGLVTSLASSDGRHDGIGYRLGLGTTVFHYSAKLPIPFAVQAGYQRVYFKDHRSSGAYFMLGLGF